MATRSTSVDPRAERVRAKIRDAAFALAHEAPVDHLTVGDIVDRAGVSRPVFYRHFGDRDDAIAYAFTTAFKSATRDIVGDPRARVLALFDFAAVHRAMYRNVVPSAVTLRIVAAFRAELGPACEQMATEADVTDIAGLTSESVGRFLVGGFIEVLRTWMEDEDGNDLRSRVIAAMDTVTALLGHRAGNRH